MTHSRHRRAARTGCAVTLLAAFVLAPGCVHVEPGGEVLYNSLAGIDAVVVAPAMNLSTRPGLDTVQVTKAFISELQQVEGITVVPVGRVYQYLQQQGMATVGSPEEARALAGVFAAQATVVLAVTEYDPYDPPRMGLAMQMYTTGTSPSPGGADFDPVGASRSAVPFPVTDDQPRPRDMISRVFSGRNREVEELAKTYAARRLSDDSPYGWRLFLVNQREFQRLCSYGIIREMMGHEGRKPQPDRIKIGPREQKWPK